MRARRQRAVSVRVLGCRHLRRGHRTLQVRRRMRWCRLLGASQLGDVHSALSVGGGVALRRSTDQSATGDDNSFASNYGNDHDHAARADDAAGDFAANAVADRLRSVSGLDGARLFRSCKHHHVVSMLREQLLRNAARLCGKRPILRCGRHVHSVSGHVFIRPGANTATNYASTASSARVCAVHIDVRHHRVVSMVRVLWQQLWRVSRILSP